MDKKKIVPAFWPFFKEHGYKKWGTTKFYRIENDIAFCFLLERPSIIVYPTYYIWPLYIPTDVVPLSYGNRLNEGDYGYCLWDDDSTFEPWVEKLKKCLETTVFPFYESINSPEKLWQLISQEDFGTPNYLFCPPHLMKRLQMYTACYMGDLMSARKYFDFLIDNHPSPNYVKENIDQWTCMIESPQEVREAFFRDTIRKNKETFWHIRPQADKK